MIMLSYLIQVTIIMGVFYGFYHVALRKETLFEVNRAYLLTTLLVSFCLPGVQIEITTESLRSEMLSTVVMMESSVSGLSDNLSATTLSSFSLRQFIMAIYFVGVVFMSSRLAMAYRQLQQMRKAGTRCTIQGRDCLLSEKVNSPFSFFSLIYLPADLRYSNSELSEVMAHETAHVEEHHTLDILLIELLAIVCWFNPVIYLYKKSLSDVHEYIADRAVLKFSQWENYAQLLLRQQYRQVPNALSHQLIYSQLKNRLKMMTSKPSGAAARFKYLGALPALLVCFALFSFTIQDQSLTQNDPMIQNKQSISGGYDLPVFPGCEKESESDQKSCTSMKLSQYIGDNLVFPESLKKEGKEGRVVAKFVVDKDGMVKDVEIARSLHKDADLAVLSLIRNLNEKVGKWIPVMKDGKAVDAVMHIPVQFKFGDDE